MKRFLGHGWARAFVGVVTALLVFGAFGSTSASADTRTPTYVAVGDSYPAGFGLGSLLPDSGDHCQRSSLAYPFLTTAAVFANPQDWGCPGAGTAALGSSQLSHITAAQSATTRVAAVSVLVGGNDAGLVQCVLQPKCKFDNKALKTRLVSTFTAIAARAPGVKVFVQVYPTLLPARTSGPCGLPYPSTIAKAFKKVDKAILSSAKKAAKGQATTGSHFVLVNDTAAFNGHEECRTGVTSWVDASNLHPNLAGHQQMARDLDYCATVPVGTKLTICVPPHP